jgi:Undecaprenyl-phosphate galactose phosphotransferase WbaP
MLYPRNCSHGSLGAASPGPASLAPCVMKRAAWTMAAWLAVSDAIAISVSLAAAACLQMQSSGFASLKPFVELWPFTSVFLIIYWMNGLYAGCGLSEPEELKRGAICSCGMFVIMAALTPSASGRSHLFTATLLAATIGNAVIMPVLRATLRSLASRAGWWGYPAIIFGSGAEAAHIVEMSRRSPDIGLRPILVVDPAPEAPACVCGLPVLASLSAAAPLLHFRSPLYGVIALPNASAQDVATLILGPESAIFARWLLISNTSSITPMWAVPKSVGGLLTLDLDPRTHTPTTLVGKRALDLFLSVLLLLFFLPLMLVIAMGIKLTSRGSVLYGHKRIGMNGRTFSPWKFRTMYQESDLLLAKLLASDPAARRAWARQRKLARDPRITPFGHFLRTSSLDELPQLWNVVRGEMSLVGPRPIMQDEVRQYGESYSVCSQVPSGVTGLWQVSGRSSTSYSERVLLDVFYVRNWSMWLDLSILLRTCGVVAFRKGAC